MNLKKFEEYEIDNDGDNIAIEYAKYIISEYLDKKNDETLESVYSEIIKGDKLDEELEYIIKNELQDYLYNLYENARKIRKIIKITADKYKL